MFLLAIAGFFITNRVVQKKRIAESYAEGLKQEWVEMLEQKMGLYKILPDDLKVILQGHVNYFLKTKSFHAVDDLIITDEMRVTIAGDACLPVLKRKDPIYPDFKTIFICPDVYKRTGFERNGAVLNEVMHTSSGVSWLKGPLLLAWNYASHGSSNKTDGANVTLHEFAHKLDGENGAANGLPILRHKNDYDKWNRVMTREYDDLCKRVNRGANKILDEYGATSPAEFFAVATEAFFEKSLEFKKYLPRLYAQLAKYYDLNPAVWHKNYQARLRQERKM